MHQLTISQVARQIGVRSSTIRYYEQIGVLSPAQRTSSQRRYDNTVLHRLAVIQRARQTGFALDEIRTLFFGFRDGTSASQRWRKLSRRKLAELETRIRQIKTMQRLIREMMRCCRCETLDQCGRGILKSALRNGGANGLMKSATLKSGGWRSISQRHGH